MDLLNFAIDGQYIGLEWAPNHYADLHNNFCFENLHYSSATATLKLSWRKSSSKWARHEPWQALHLLFEGVSYWQVREREPTYPLSEDQTLQHICRTPPEARTEFENIYFNEDAQPCWDLTLHFQSEWGIKVSSTTVRLQVET